MSATDPTAGKGILVLGLGRSGEAAARLARGRGQTVTVLDAADTPELRAKGAELGEAGIEVRLGWSSATAPAPADLVVISPGIPDGSLLGRLAASAGCPVVSELDYGFAACACPVLAVTGTNGKTTTVEMLNHCLAGAGFRTEAAGNIGTPLCSLAKASEQLDYLVVEVSSFQLQHAQRFAPAAAAFLNFSLDHLNWHADMREYLLAKCRIFSHLPEAGRAVLRLDLLELPEVRAALPKSGGRCTVFALQEDPAADFFVDAAGHLAWRRPGGVERLLPADAMLVRGGHNLENALAALATAAAAGIDPRLLAPPLRTFSTGRHRLEDLGVVDGVRYINDSKSTNPDSLCRALEAVGPAAGGRLILIAGGVDKNLDFSSARPLLARWVDKVFLIGSCRERLAIQWQDAVSCSVVPSFGEAMTAAAGAAGAGHTVLLSPGCASFDMFRDYAERGECFCDFVERKKIHD